MSKPYLHPCVVEFEDVDAYGIAHHSRLITFLERARVHFFEDHDISVHDGDFQLVLVNLNVDFKKPAKMMDRLVISLEVDRLRGASLVWVYRLSRGEDVILEAELKMASVGADLRPCRFPEGVLKALEGIKC
jgi:YbgC/YbaW family acyl-CoA thioester hydrolase